MTYISLGFYITQSIISTADGVKCVGTCGPVKRYYVSPRLTIGVNSGRSFFPSAAFQVVYASFTDALPCFPTPSHNFVLDFSIQNPLSFSRSNPTFTIYFLYQYGLECSF